MNNKRCNYVYVCWETTLLRLSQNGVERSRIIKRGEDTSGRFIEELSMRKFIMLSLVRKMSTQNIFIGPMDVPLISCWTIIVRQKSPF